MFQIMFDWSEISQVNKACQRLSFQSWRTITYCSHNAHNACHLPKLSDSIVSSITARSAKHLRGLHISQWPGQDYFDFFDVENFCHAPLISDQAFEHVGECKGLEYVLVAACPAVNGDAIAHHFQALPRITLLALIDIAISPSSLQQLTQASAPRLRTLRFKNNHAPADTEGRYPIFDRVLFTPFVQLSHVDIQGAIFKQSEHSPSIFEQLSTLSHLTYLKLANCAFCLDDFSLLAKCTTLEKLYFFNEGDRVKDSHLVAFRSLTRLQKLALGPFDDSEFVGDGVVHLTYLILYACIDYMTHPQKLPEFT